MANPSGPPTRPRMFSVGSQKSSLSRKGSTNHGYDMQETPEEKARKTIKTKADPRMAILEDEPSSVATGATSIQSIRTLQHKDSNGNPIADPDRSNPTRSRWERPLDTIRAFEAAVDDSHRTKSMARPESVDPYASRRSSYVQPYNQPQRPHTELGHYGGRYGAMPRPESVVDSYYGSPPPHPHPHARYRPPPRMATEPAYHMQGPGPSGYPTHGYPQPYDAATTASGSGSQATDPWGNSTDPSSENSSLDRGQLAPKPDLGDAYGAPGAGAPPHLHPGDMDPAGGPMGRGGYGPGGYGPSGQSPLSQSNGRYYSQGEADVAPYPPPHAPPKDHMPVARTPIKLGNSSGMPSGVPSGGGGMGLPTNPRPQLGDKRKSWFKRFSKAG
ncbi:MAG: hypothetical protein M1838_005635 [Thelocarpon superellum]|nr:MAG: hypothetical protein M1838_005635 [Thelocarpon superellum]